MERQTRRSSFVPSGAAKDDGYEEYKLQTRGEYEELMQEFEFRCKRAATMHYYEASRYDKIIYYMEVGSAVVGALSALAVGVFLLQGSGSSSSSDEQSKSPKAPKPASKLKLPSLSGASLSDTSKLPSLESLASSFDPSAFEGNLGAVGLFGIGIVVLMAVMGKGGGKFLPTFSSRQNLHVSTAAAWQKLAMKTRSFRVMLDNPRIDVTDYQDWYLKLVDEREELCTRVTLPQSTYKLYCDPKRVFKPMRQRRMMYLKYLQLEDLTAEESPNNIDDGTEL